MNKITFPLKRGMKRLAVGDLQDALQLLLNRGVLLANDEAARRRLSGFLSCLEPKNCVRLLGTT